MIRTAIVVVAVGMAVMISPSTRADDDPIQPGDKFEGRLTKMISSPWLKYVDTFYAYGTDVPIRLKAGQRISITATVTGTGRKVSVALLDPDGKMIAASERNTAVTAVMLPVKEVNDTDTFMIRVMSDQRGVFSVETSGPVATKLDEEALEKKIKQLEQELKKAKEQLEALRKKRKK